MYSSNALIYDAVQVLSKALNDLASMEVIKEKMVYAKYAQSVDAKFNGLMKMEILDAKLNTLVQKNLSKALNDLASIEVIAEKMVDATYSW